jgi:ABC-2 type transport system ATP-binding protein
MGKTIFFSSHILSDVDELCTEVGIIEAGKIVAWGDIRSLRAQIKAQRTIYLTVMGDTLDQAKVVLSQIPAVIEIKHGDRNAEGDWDLELLFSGDKLAASDLISKLVAAGLPLLAFREEIETLEDVFMRLTAGIVS